MLDLADDISRLKNCSIEPIWKAQNSYFFGILKLGVGLKNHISPDTNE